MAAGPFKLTLNPPDPVPGTGECRVHQLMDVRTYCTRRATRKVALGLSAAVDVCTWHSLVMCQRTHAHLVRTSHQRHR